jgi:hypothetical protein
LRYHGNAALQAYARVSRYAMIVRFALSKHPGNGAAGGADRKTASDTAEVLAALTFSNACIHSAFTFKTAKAVPNIKIEQKRS